MKAFADFIIAAFPFIAGAYLIGLIAYGISDSKAKYHALFDYYYNGKYVETTTFSLQLIWTHLAKFFAKYSKGIVAFPNNGTKYECPLAIVMPHNVTYVHMIDGVGKLSPLYMHDEVSGYELLAKNPITKKQESNVLKIATDLTVSRFSQIKSVYSLWLNNYVKVNPEEEEMTYSHVFYICNATLDTSIIEQETAKTNNQFVVKSVTELADVLLSHEDLLTRKNAHEFSQDEVENIMDYLMYISPEDKAPHEISAEERNRRIQAFYDSLATFPEKKNILKRVFSK